MLAVQCSLCLFGLAALLIHNLFVASLLVSTFGVCICVLAVFLDLVMPGLDGFEVCRRIRSEPDLRSCGIPFMAVAKADM